MAAHSAEKRAAVLADLAAGESVNSVATKHSIARSTITGWRDQAGLRTISDIDRQQKKDLGLQVYELLEDSILTLRIQLQLARDPDWFKRQNANDLAVYLGVVSDKTTRLLAAFRPAENGATDSGD